MHGTKAVGTNTAARTKATPITGPVISFMASRVASLGGKPSCMWRSTASTTTMASSTTNPIAKTSPNKESVLIENPSKGKKTNVPTNETGTASNGIKVARQLCKKRKTTAATKTRASASVLIIS